jgi:hypothetical protein
MVEPSVASSVFEPDVVSVSVGAGRGGIFFASRPMALASSEFDEVAIEMHQNMISLTGQWRY